MIIYYTAREVFADGYNAGDYTWQKYIAWSRLSQLTELISVDGMLNRELVLPNWNSEEDWTYIVTDGDYVTGFYNSLDYVLSKIQPNERFNLLALAINPSDECKHTQLDNFEFVGYDLLDKDYGISALSNCRGFDETFLPADLNAFGLISNYEKARDVQRRLLENNPDEYHADTNVIAIWRHKTLGRLKTRY